MTSIQVSGIQVSVGSDGVCRHAGRNLGRVDREERFGQWFWRAFSPEDGKAYKRFFTSRPEAIQLLLIYADLLDGLGF